MKNGFHSLTAERVKISSTNLRLETTVLQKEETLQVVIDIIKNFTCFKAFTISADVPEINMQHFWYTIKKVQGTHSYEFLLTNKNCRVDAEEYGLAILDVMLNDVIKQSESYQMFIKYSTGQIPLKKRRGKETASRRVVKKKVTIFVDDNIIPDPDIALEIVTEYVPESAKKKTGSRSSKSVVIQDTPSSPKTKPITSKPKLKGAHSLTPAEKEVVDIMQALKESKKTSKRHPGAGGSSEGTGTLPRVPDVTPPNWVAAE
ncbi:hypothetical protein Tco_0371628 [Tanacetum coccineum]